MATPVDPETRVAPPTKLKRVATLNQLIDRAKATRPEIAQTKHLIRSQDAKVSLAKSQYGPDLTLRWGYNDLPQQSDAWTGRVMVSVPLWAASKQRFGVRESKAMLKRAKTLSEEATLMTEAEVKSAHALYRAATKRIDVFARKVVPRAKAYLSATKEGYRAGNDDFTDVVEGIMKLRHSELELIRARVDQQRAYADLERAVGSSPSKEGS